MFNFQRHFIKQYIWVHTKQFYKFSSNSQNYYQILGLSTKATNDEIKKKFHELAKLYHPDAQNSKQSDEEKFKEIIIAYKTLIDNQLRMKYDQQFIQNNSQNQNQNNNYRQKKENQFYNQGKQYKDEQEKEAKDKIHRDDYVYDGFFANMREAPELYFMSGLIIVILLRWYFNLIETRRLSKQISYPEDPEFLEERERDLNIQGMQKIKIYIHPSECKQIPILVLQQMYQSGRYKFPTECQERIELQNNINQNIDKNQQSKKQSSRNQHKQVHSIDDETQSIGKNLYEEEDLIKSIMIFKKQMINENLDHINQDNLGEVMQESKKQS